MVTARKRWMRLDISWLGRVTIPGIPERCPVVSAGRLSGRFAMFPPGG